MKEDATHFQVLVAWQHVFEHQRLRLGATEATEEVDHQVAVHLATRQLWVETCTLCLQGMAFSFESNANHKNKISKHLFTNIPIAFTGTSRN